MAFALAGLNPGASPGGRGRSPVLHTYRTADDIADVEANDYFNSVDQLFTTGDFVLVNAADGSSLYVITNTSGDISLGAVATGTGGATTALTENAGAIGGTNDGDLPDLTATAATVTGTLTGSTDGALADVAAIALSTSDTYSDAAVNTAVNTAITNTNLQLKELQVALNEVIADNVALRAAIREVAAKVNVIIA